MDGNEEKDILFSTLNDYKTKNTDFVDLLTFNFAKKNGLKILSFDKDYGRLGVSVKVEP